MALQISAFFGNPIRPTAFEYPRGAQRATKLPLSTSLILVSYYRRQISLLCHPRRARLAATRSTRSIRCPKARRMPRSCPLVGKVRCDFEGHTDHGRVNALHPISSGQVGVTNPEGRVPLTQNHQKHQRIGSRFNALFCQSQVPLLTWVWINGRQSGRRLGTHS